MDWSIIIIWPLIGLAYVALGVGAMFFLALIFETLYDFCEALYDYLMKK